MICRNSTKTCFRWDTELKRLKSELILQATCNQHEAAAVAIISHFKTDKEFSLEMIGNSRTSMARTLLTRLPRLSRTRS